MKIIYKGQELNARTGMTLRDAIIKLGLDPQAVLGVRNGELINEETILGEADVIKLIPVISGGALEDGSQEPW